MKKIIILCINILITSTIYTSARQLQDWSLDDATDNRTDLEKELHEAISFGNSKEVQRLLLKKVDPNKRNPKEKGNTPLHMAAQRDLSDIVALLLMHPKIYLYKHNYESETVMHAAAQGNSVASLKKILYFESTMIEPQISLIEYLDNKSRNVLHTSAFHGSLDITLFLLNQFPGFYHTRDDHNKKPSDLIDDEDTEMKLVFQNRK